MPSVWIRSAVLFAAVLCTQHLSFGAGLEDLSAPREAVSDASAVLPPDVRRSLETLLLEHDRITGEQVVLAIASDGHSEDELQGIARRLHDRWRIGKRFGRGQGLLLIIDAKSRRFVIAEGVGFEAAGLSDRWVKLASAVADELSSGRLNRAAQTAVAEVLRAIESPLVVSGKVDEALAAISIRQQSQTRERQPGKTSDLARTVLPILAALGALTLAGWIVIRLIEAEVHYEATGWRRIHPFRLAWSRNRHRPTEGAIGGW